MRIFSGRCVTLFLVLVFFPFCFAVADYDFKEIQANQLIVFIREDLKSLQGGLRPTHLRDSMKQFAAS